MTIPARKVPIISRFPRNFVAPDGRFAAIWQDDRLNQDYADVYCRLFNADGTAAGDEFRVNQVTYGTQAWCYASNMDSQDNFVVSWTDYGRDGFPQAFARMMNFDAGVQGDEFAIEQQPQVLANIHSHTPRLSMSEVGTFVATFVLYTTPDDSSGWAGYVQRFSFAPDGNGVLQAAAEGNAFRPYATTTGDQGLWPVMSPDGSFVVAVDNVASVTEKRTFLRYYDADGTAIDSTEHEVTDSAAWTTGLGMDAGGNVMVSWRVGEWASEFDVFARRIDSTGEPMGDVIQITPETQAFHWWSTGTVSVEPDFSFLGIWTTYREDNQEFGIDAEYFAYDWCEPDAQNHVVYIDIDTAASAYFVAGQSGTSTGAFLVNRYGDLTKDLTVTYTVSGNAIPGLDYEPLSGYVTIPAGCRSASIIVQPLVSEGMSGWRDVVINFVEGADFTVGGDGNRLIINRLNPDIPGTIWPSNQRPSVYLAALDRGAADLPDGKSTGLFLVIRYGKAIWVTDHDEYFTGASSITVGYSATLHLSDPTNAANLPIPNFESLTGTVDLAAGVFAAPIVITPISDIEQEAQGYITLEIADSSSYGPLRPQAPYYEIPDWPESWATNFPMVSIVDLTLPNHVPEAAADLDYTVLWNSQETLPNRLSLDDEHGVLSNDDDGDGDFLHARLRSRPSHAAYFRLGCNGSFHYVPEEGFVGTDSFSYFVSDGLDEDYAQVTIDVYDQAPAALDDSYEVNQDSTLWVRPNGALANDVDIDGDELNSLLVDGPSHGSVYLFKNGSFRYRPSYGYSGMDSFVYGTTDGHFTDQAVVYLNVLAVAPPQLTIEYLHNPNWGPDLPTDPSQQGTTGWLTYDNPDGAGDNSTPDFKGGYRFFPDAYSSSKNNEARNIVRIRATIKNPPLGTNSIWFRSFDVDDPSSDQVIDSNGNSGNDNLGSVNFGNPSLPLRAAPLGYVGLLRPINQDGQRGAFAFPIGKPVQADIRQDADGSLYAEVELATSFNPGDNFRVAAAFSSNDLEQLNADDVPTNGAIPGGVQFGGVITEQLSVWRYMHVERDLMRQIEVRGLMPIVVTSVGNAVIENNQVVLEADRIPGSGEIYVGGLLHDNAGNSFVITKVEKAPGAVRGTMYVYLPDPNGTLRPVTGKASIAQGDMQAGVIESFTRSSGILFNVSLKFKDGGRVKFARINEYEFGQLTTTKGSFVVVGNTAGDGSQLQVLFNGSDQAASALVGSYATVFDDDFAESSPEKPSVVTSSVWSANPDGNNFVLYLGSVFGTDEFKDGFVKQGTNYYRVIANTGEPFTRLTVSVSAGTPAPSTGEIALIRKPSGAAGPKLIINPHDGDHLFTMMKPSLVRNSNRYAGAYIEPEYEQLSQFNGDIPPMTYVPGDLFLLEPYRGSKNVESNYYWVVYVATAFQHEPRNSFDPRIPNQPIVAGVTDGASQSSAVFFEVVREASVFLTRPIPQLLSMITTHEVGHQFQLAAGIAVGANGSGGHRDDVPNIMNTALMEVTAEQYFFHPRDILGMRKRYQSPNGSGTNL